jgi:hypothetical protein
MILALLFVNSGWKCSGLYCPEAKNVPNFSLLWDSDPALYGFFDSMVSRNVPRNAFSLFCKTGSSRFTCFAVLRAGKNAFRETAKQ